MAETASIDAQVVEEKKEALFSKKNRNSEQTIMCYRTYCKTDALSVTFSEHPCAFCMFDPRNLAEPYFTGRATH